MTLRPEWLPALAAFEAAARHQNFARAAEELHLTASAVSHHVRRLEARLGRILFQRHARGVALTADGRQLADAASSAFSDVEAVVQGLRAPRPRQEQVRLTTLHSLAHAWLIPRLAEFTRQHPDIGIRIETEIALTRFDEGGPDLGIRHGPGQWPGLHAQYLMGDALFPVSDPDRARDIRGAADVIRHPLIGDLARQGWPDWLRAAGIRQQPADERYVFSDSTDTLHAAASGLGVALAREKIVAPWLDSGKLVVLPGPRLEARWSYHLIHPEHRRLRPPARLLADWLLAIARHA